MAGDAIAFANQILVTCFVIRVDHVSDILAVTLESRFAQASMTFADNAIDAALSAAGDGRHIFVNGGWILNDHRVWFAFAFICKCQILSYFGSFTLCDIEHARVAICVPIRATNRVVFRSADLGAILPVQGALSLSKRRVLDVGNLLSVRVNAPTAAIVALHRLKFAVDVTLGTEHVTKSGVKQTICLAPLTLTFRQDWSGWGDLQPVRALRGAVAFHGRDASLLPELVLAVIKQLSRWTPALLAGKDAVGILADEIGRWIAMDAYFVFPHLPSGERRQI